MSPAEPAQSRFDPPQVGRYEVHEEIGRGSTGTVYLARDPLIGRWVALKTLSKEISADSERVEALRRRLLNEARSAGALSHPGIVSVHDVVEHGEGRLSIAMELVEGTDLRRRLENPEPVPLEFSARVVSEVGEVLDYAHSLGVVHRDIKPANILLGNDNSIKVTDFGIASLRNADLADELKNLGSPNYLAPERLLGEPAEARSDIYALGVVLYEMLTRNPPFVGDSLAELVRNIVHEEPRPVDHYRPDVYPEVHAILARALAKEPAERYQTAGELSRDLRGALDRRSKHNDTVPTPLFEEVALESPTAPEEFPAEQPGVADDEEEVVAATGVVEPTVPGTASSEIPPASAPKASRRAVTASPAVGGSSGQRRRSRTALWLIPVVLGLAVATAAFFSRGRTAPATEGVPLQVAGVGEDRLEYLGLLAESRRLLALGDREAAERLLDRAEELSPAADRIRRLRDTARQEAAAERGALTEAEALDRLDAARAHVEAGRLRSAASAVASALTLVPDDPEALRLRDYIARRRAQQAARARAREVLPEPVVEEPVEEVEGFQPFTQERVAAPAVVPTLESVGDLRVDFYSERPRGVLTIYSGSLQVLNRPFRFVEKKKMLRRKGISGGFDEKARVPAGELELRIYLSLPDRETQLQTLPGLLPAGSLRTLRARVDADGNLTAELH